MCWGKSERELWEARMTEALRERDEEPEDVVREPEERDEEREEVLERV